MLDRVASLSDAERQGGLCARGADSEVSFASLSLLVHDRGSTQVISDAASLSSCLKRKTIRKDEGRAGAYTAALHHTGFVF